MPVLKILWDQGESAVTKIIESFFQKKPIHTFSSDPSMFLHNNPDFIKTVKSTSADTWEQLYASMQPWRTLLCAPRLVKDMTYTRRIKLNSFDIAHKIILHC